LETWAHEASTFATFTFDRPAYSVRPEHLRRLIARLRKRFKDRRIRYFGVGEYGDETFRSHYHVALFGVSELEERKVQDSWIASFTGVDGDVEGSPGFISLRPLDANRAQYLAGYVVKKMVRKDDDRLSAGMHPEFARMSTRPGIGAGAIEKLAQAIDVPGIIEGCDDVPMSIRLSGKIYPLGRYLRERLRDEIGFTEEYKETLKQRFYAAKTAEMQELLSATEMDVSTWSWRSRLLADVDAPKANALERRSTRKRKGSTL
jgi:hypothetical protein